MRPPRSVTISVPLLCVVAACGAPRSHVTAPPRERAVGATTVAYTDTLARFLDLADGAWNWSWRLAASGGDTVRGTATLTIAGSVASWSFLADGPDGTPAVSAALAELRPGALRLTCDEPTLWHDLRVQLPAARPDALLPLPRLPVTSAYYADLLDLLQRLTLPRFGMRVTHWPATPIPVLAGRAVSGEIDLAACLAEAAAIWNGAAGRTVFALAPDAAWGVRLTHNPGIASPPLATCIARLDGVGRPLELTILSGDNYTQAPQRAAVVRGMAHELAHTLLMWGHSEDRAHLLWRCGPLTARPSADELRAIALWELLPEGCELAAYGRSVELDPQRQQCQRTPVEH
jgi:hypothetical protein